MTLEELKTKSSAELKVLAYDTMATIQQMQQTLQVLNGLIAEKKEEHVNGNPTISEGKTSNQPK